MSTKQSGCEYSTGETESSDILYSFPVPPSANEESGVIHDTMSNHDSLSDSDTESVLEHTDLQQKEDSLEPSESDSEPEIEGDTEALLKESNSENYNEDVRPSVSRTYKYEQSIKQNTYCYSVIIIERNIQGRNLSQISISWRNIAINRSIPYIAALADDSQMMTSVKVFSLESFLPQLYSYHNNGSYSQSNDHNIIIV